MLQECHGCSDSRRKVSVLQPTHTHTHSVVIVVHLYTALSQQDEDRFDRRVSYQSFLAEVLSAEA